MKSPPCFQYNGITVYPTLDALNWQNTLKPFPNPASLLIFLKQQGVSFVHPDLPVGTCLNRYEYDQLPKYNWSRLRNWRDLMDQSRNATSPKDAFFLEKNPEQMSEEMRAGIIAHLYALGDDKDGLQPSEFKKFNSNEAKTAKNKAYDNGKILLREDEPQKYEAFLEAFRLSGIHDTTDMPPPGIQELLNAGFKTLGDLVNAGNIELAITGELDVCITPDTNPIPMPVKGRADLIIDLPDGRRFLFDLKTQNGKSNIANVHYKIGDMGYDAQMGLYAHMCGATAAYIITANTAPPYQTVVTHLPAPTLAQGVEIARRALRNYKYYHDQQHFPGLSSNEYGGMSRPCKSMTQTTQANSKSPVIELDDEEFEKIGEAA